MAKSEENFKMNSNFTPSDELSAQFHGQMGYVGLKLIHVTIN